MRHPRPSAPSNHAGVPHGLAGQGFAAPRFLAACLVAATVAATACDGSDPPLGPDDGSLDAADTAVVASVSVYDDPKVLSVLGSTAGLHVYARDSTGTVLCAVQAVNCDPRLLDRPFAWTLEPAGVVAMQPRDGGLYETGAVWVEALAEGTTTVTATVIGVAGSAAVTVVERARIDWSFPTPGSYNGMALAEDGTIYLAGYDGLSALEPTGALRWSVQVRTLASPALGVDGTIYVGVSDDGPGDALMAIDPNGAVLWTTPIERIFGASPAVGPDGTVYQISGDGTLYAFGTDGAILWEFSAPGELPRNRTSPAIALDGTIYFGSQDHRLYALDPDGNELWRFDTGGDVQSPSIGVDGTIYVTNDRIVEFRPDTFLVHADAKLRALNEDGTERWSHVLEDDVQAGPAIGFDGTVYVGSNNWIWVLDPGGSLLWTEHAGTRYTPIVAGNGSIYGNIGGATALDETGAVTWRYESRHGSVGAMVIGPDGTLYATSSNAPTERRLHAFTELAGSNGGYDAAPWPQERGDRQNSGRARSGPGS